MEHHFVTRGQMHLKEPPLISEIVFVSMWLKGSRTLSSLVLTWWTVAANQKTALGRKNTQ